MDARIIHPFQTKLLLAGLCAAWLLLGSCSVLKPKDCDCPKFSSAPALVDEHANYAQNQAARPESSHKADEASSWRASQ